MCGCWSRAASWISRWKRSAFTPAARSGGSTLTTTGGRGGVAGEEDAAHAAAAELALELHGGAKRGRQLFAERSSHFVVLL